MPDTRRSTSPVWPGGLSLQGPHRVGAFALCPQLEAFGYELGLRPIMPKPAPAIGNLVHVGLAYRYGTLLAQRPEWLVYPDGRWAIWNCGQDTPNYAEEAMRVFDAYEAHYQVNVWQPLLVEHQFKIEMEGEPYTCRSDLIALEGADAVLIDHKTVSRMKSRIGRDYRMDRQMLTGLWLARAHGYDVRRVIINALSKETPPRFERFDVPISAEAYGRLDEDTRHTLRAMKHVRERFPDPLKRPRTLESCVRKYGQCDFWRLCADGLTDAHLEFHRPEKH